MNNVYKVRGITCSQCKEKIEKNLSNKKGIQKAQVYLKTTSLEIDYDPRQIRLQEIKKILEVLGYELMEELESQEEKPKKVWMLAGIAILLFLIISSIVPDFSTLLTGGNSLSLIMLFIIGMTTSFHCISMCGGIALSQVTNEKDNIKRNILYNIGRIISYTLLGGIVGAVGAGITLGNTFFAVVPIVLGCLMVITGLNNAGVVALTNLKLMQHLNLKLSKIRYQFSHDRGPFILGLVNGLMPCGPLQMMQIYALGIGSFIQGALAMLAFSLGTVPLMLGLGVFINKLSVGSKALVFKMGGYLVVVLGISMMLNGLTTAGINTVLASGNSLANRNVIMEDGYQVVNVDVGPRSYEDIVVQKDIPVRLKMNVKPGNLTGCNYAVNIPEYEIFASLQEGENVFEFMPTEEGTFMYSCWMGMIRNTITVVE